MLKFCGICCLCLSVWGFVQLVIMGILYMKETLCFVEEATPEEFTGLQDFLDKTSKNFKSISTNCFIAAAIYLVIMCCALLCISKAKKKEKIKMDKLLDDDASCTFEVVELTEKQKKKIT